MSPAQRRSKRPVNGLTPGLQQGPPAIALKRGVTAGPFPRVARAEVCHFLLTAIRW